MSGKSEFFPDSKAHGTNMGPSGADMTQVGPKYGPMNFVNFAIWVILQN